MAKMNLTDKAVRAAKADASQRLEMWDTGCKGLCLRVSDSGKAWFYRYRAPDGRQPRVKLGDFSDEFGLAAARTKANRLRVAVQEGRDPAAETRKAKAAAKAETIRTFDALADAFLDASERGDWKPKGKQKRDRTIADERGVLKRHIRPTLGKLKPADIDRKAVRSLLQKMKAAGIGAQTVKAHATIRQVFAYAISEELAGVVANPAVGFASPVTQTARTRILSDDELKCLWGALVDPTGLTNPQGEKVTVGRQVRIILQLAALLLVRRAEIAGMTRAELDLAAGTWLIPGERMKGGLPHLVPLPPKASLLIGEAIKLAEVDRQEAPIHVFPSPHNAERAIRPDSVTHAMAEINAALGIKGATPHDLRRTGSTAMTSERLGVSHFIRSQVLSHRSDAGGGSAVSMAHYDANSYLPEKRRALEAWEGLLLEIVGEKLRPSNVTAMREAS